MQIPDPSTALFKFLCPTAVWWWVLSVTERGMLTCAAEVVNMTLLSVLSFFVYAFWSCVFRYIHT